MFCLLCRASLSNVLFVVKDEPNKDGCFACCAGRAYVMFCLLRRTSLIKMDALLCFACCAGRA